MASGILLARGGMKFIVRWLMRIQISDDPCMAGRRQVRCGDAVVSGPVVHAPVVLHAKPGRLQLGGDFRGGKQANERLAPHAHFR